jgi:hypothetical protein
MPGKSNRTAWSMLLKSQSMNHHYQGRSSWDKYCKDKHHRGNHEEIQDRSGKTRSEGPYLDNFNLSTPSVMLGWKISSSKDGPKIDYYRRYHLHWCEDQRRLPKILTYSIAKHYYYKTSTRRLGSSLLLTPAEGRETDLLPTPTREGVTNLR